MAGDILDALFNTTIDYGQGLSIGTTTTISNTTASNVQFYPNPTHQGLSNQALNTMGQQYAQQLGQSMQHTLAQTAAQIYGQGFPGIPRLRSFATLTADALQSEAFKAPLDTLVDLWVCKFGDDWVDKEHVIGDAFFEIAAQRLMKLARMEEYQIYDDTTTAMRKQLIQVVLRVVR